MIIKDQKTKPFPIDLQPNRDQPSRKYSEYN